MSSNQVIGFIIMLGALLMLQSIAEPPHWFTVLVFAAFGVGAGFATLDLRWGKRQ